VAAELFGVPPEEFVAARGAIVKRLRAAKDRDAASEVAGWRRPSVADWALNLVARRSGSTVERFLEVAESARGAQEAAVEGRADAGRLRAVVADLRSATDAMLSAAEAALVDRDRAAAPHVAALGTRLNEIATNPALGDQLRVGCLGAGEVAAVDLFGGLPPAPSRPASGAAGRGGPGPARSGEPGRPPRRRAAGTASRPKDDVTAAAGDAGAGEAERQRRRKEASDALDVALAKQAAVASAHAEVEQRARGAEVAVAESHERERRAREREAAARTSLEAALTELRSAEEERERAEHAVEVAAAAGEETAQQLAVASAEVERARQAVDEAGPVRDRGRNGRRAGRP
jgi:hypothetical protein